MKITNGHQQYLNAIRTNQKTDTNKAAAEIKPTRKKESVSVKISDEAKRLSEELKNTAPSERAEQIRLAIQKGTYPVSPENIANKMVEAMKIQREEQNE